MNNIPIDCFWRKSSFNTKTYYYLNRYIDKWSEYSTNVWIQMSWSVRVEKFYEPSFYSIPFFILFVFLRRCNWCVKGTAISITYCFMGYLLLYFTSVVPLRTLIPCLFIVSENHFEKTYQGTFNLTRHSLMKTMFYVKSFFYRYR